MILYTDRKPYPPYSGDDDLVLCIAKTPSITSVHDYIHFCHPDNVYVQIESGLYNLKKEISLVGYRYPVQICDEFSEIYTSHAPDPWRVIITTHYEYLSNKNIMPIFRNLQKYYAYHVYYEKDKSGSRFISIKKSKSPILWNEDIDNQPVFMSKKFNTLFTCNCNVRSVPNMNRIPEIENVIFNPPATVVFWSDGTKTVVKCGDMDLYSRETGLAMCIAKKVYGNKGSYFNEFKKWIKPYWTYTDDAAHAEILKIINKTRNQCNDKNTANDIIKKMNPDSIIPICSLNSDEVKLIKRLCKMYLEAVEN